jgi:polar amino acid transport system substrate-binding protein
MEEDENGVAGGPMTLPMQQLADELGVKYVPVSTTWANIVAGLQADRYDVAAYLDNTLERATAIQFSDPVLTYQGVFVVKADSPHSTSEDLLSSKAKLAIAQGTAYGDRLKALSDNVLELDTIPNGLAALKADRAEALFVDLPTAEGAAASDENLKIIVPDPVIYQSGSGYGVADDIDPRSLQLINIAVRDAQDYGDLSIAFNEVGFREVEDLGEWLKK